MITRNALRAVAVATACLAPLVASAQDFSLEPTATPDAPAAPAAPTTIGTAVNGDIQIGGMGVMGQNANQAGRYNGLNTTGFDAVIGEFNLGTRDSWESGGTRYFMLNGNNLVFQTGNVSTSNGFGSGANNRLANNGSVELKTGQQGTWGFDAYYDAITYTGNVIDSVYDVNGSQASLNGSLTPFGGATASKVGAHTAFTIPQLQATNALQGVQTGTRRDIFGGNFKYTDGDWTFTGAIRHEHKEGSMEDSFDGPWGGTAFALPVDYDTTRYDASIAYTTHLFQGSLQYTFSQFTDNNLFVSLPYPTSNTAAPFQRTAAYSTPPSNEAHYVTIMLASNIIPLTRINLNARVGVEKQDDTFAPNTADPSGANLIGANLIGLNSALQGTTAGSPDITATVYQLKVSAASHPFANADTRVWYGIDGRNVTLNQYKVFTGGTGGSAADTTPGGATNFAFVVPQDWLKQNAGAELGYRIIPEYDTKLTIGYRLDAVDRSNAQVGHSSTSTASIALLSDLGPDLDGKLSFDYSNRTGNLTYFGPWTWLGQGPTYSGAYYQAPMTSEAVTLRADYTPTHSLSGDFFVQFKNENYTYPAATSSSGTLANGTAFVASAPITGQGYGLKRDYALSFGPDIDYRPIETVSIHLYYTYELLFFNNLGNGACSTAAQAVTALCTGTAGYFQNQQTTSTNTVGVSGEWKVNEKLKLKGEYTFSYGSVGFTQFNGVFVPNPTTSYQNVSNYPDINSTMNMVKLTATYQLAPSMELVLQGIYAYFHNPDWNDTNTTGIVGTTTGSAAIGYLTPGYSSPNYSVGMIMTGIKFRF